MLEAVPWDNVSVSEAEFGWSGKIVRILQPTSWQLERFDPWELKDTQISALFRSRVKGVMRLTDDERNH